MTKHPLVPDEPQEDPLAAAARARHDLRTPLNHIIGYSEMLEEEARERGLDDLVPDLVRVQQAARTLQALIERHFGAARAGVPASLAQGDGLSLSGRSAAAQEARAQMAAVRESLAEGQTEGVLRDATLLVVDDSEENRDVLSRRLRERGYAVITAAGGAEALRHVAERAVDLVLLDVMMPDVSGIEVLRGLRAEHTVSDLPIIMVTGLDRSEDTVAALQLGANDYVTKPLDFQVVLARVETQLALARAKKQIDSLAADLEARNAYIRATFDRYVSADIAESLLATSHGPRLGGERRRVTILICDLRGFTPMVGQLDPELVVRVLNRYLTSMTEVIREYGGTIDEFTGDGILALFGAPVTRDDDALRAVACAVKMQRAMEHVNVINEREGMPRLQMGVGLDTGDVLVGSIGSLVRAKYTAIGLAVNLAARIESCTVGGQVLASSATLEAAGPTVRVGRITCIEAKGFPDPIALHEVRGVGAPHHVTLATEVRTRRPLARPLRVRCAALEDKHLKGTRFEGAFAALDEIEAELRAELPLRPLLNLQMRLFDIDGVEVEGDVYAKVVDVDAADARLVTVRFTGMHERAAAFVRGLRS